jgi:hypothetical protein
MREVDVEIGCKLLKTKQSQASQAALSCLVHLTKQVESSRTLENEHASQAEALS